LQSNGFCTPYREMHLASGFGRFSLTGWTWQLVTDMVQPPLRSDDPGAIGPGRIVADVLVVAALEFGDPIIVLVLMKPYDFAFGHGRH
jgi:hypothetical protein